MIQNLIVIKIGGSALSDKSKTMSFRRDWIEHFLRILIKHYKQGKRFIIVHGGGSFAHPIAYSYNLRKLISKDQLIGISIVDLVLEDLNSKILQIMINQGLPARYVKTSDLFEIDKNGEVKIRDTNYLEKLLTLNLVPVLHGDVIYSERFGIEVLSGDIIVKELSKILKPKIVIYLLDVEGVYRNLKNKELIRELRSINILQKEHHQHIIDVTGGIVSKLSSCFEICKLGIDVYLCAIWDLNSIDEILNNRKPERCTRILCTE